MATVDPDADQAKSLECRSHQHWPRQGNVTSFAGTGLKRCQGTRRAVASSLIITTLTPASWLRQICCPAHLKVRGRGTLVLGCTKVLPVLSGAPHWSPRTYREGQGHMRAQRAQGSHVPVSLVWRHMAIERRHIVLPQLPNPYYQKHRHRRLPAIAEMAVITAASKAIKDRLVADLIDLYGSQEAAERAVQRAERSFVPSRVDDNFLWGRCS